MHSSCDYVSILDPNWISTLLSVISTLFIFLLSIPILFFQTFLPEDIRELYGKYSSTQHLRKFSLFKNLLLVCLVIFGNHGIIFIIKNFIVDSYCYKNTIIIIYYFICLFFLVYYCVYTYRYFIDFVFKKEDVRKEVVRILVKLVIEKYDKVKKIDNCIIEEFSELGRSFSSGGNKAILLDGITQIVKHVTKNMNEHYDGEQLSKLLDSVLIQSITEDGTLSEYNTIQIFSICDIIQRAYSKKLLKDYDSSCTVKLLNNLIPNVLRYERVSMIRRIIEVLRKFDATHDNIYSICKRCFTSQIHSIVCLEISYLISLIRNQKEKRDNYEDNLMYVCAFISWHHTSNNKFMVQYANANFTKLINEGILSREELSNIAFNFGEIFEFETANSIESYLTAGN